MTNPASSRPSAARSPDGIANGKLALLDAAEELFSRHGYHGASMREITGLAGVPHGLATYHFRSKDDLFEQVVARRGPIVLAMLDQALTDALPADGSPAPCVDVVIGAYIEAHLRFAARGEREVMYLRLTQQIIALGKRRELIGDFIVAYAPVRARYIAELGRVPGNGDPAGLVLKFHLIRFVLAGVFVDLELPAPLDLAQVEVTKTHLCAFCVRGFSAQV